MEVNTTKELPPLKYPKLFLPYVAIPERTAAALSGSHIHFSILQPFFSRKSLNSPSLAPFTLFLGGRDALGKEAIGTSVCAMLQAEIPAFLVELGRTVEQSGKSFDEWIEANEETLRTIAQKYAK